MWLFESCFFVCLFFCTYGHARTGTHVRARGSEGTACVVVVSGPRFEFFFLHIRPRMIKIAAIEKKGEKRECHKGSTCRRKFKWCLSVRPSEMCVCSYLKAYTLKRAETWTIHWIILVRARKCVPIRAWPYVQKNPKNFQTACQKQQPHKPFLRSHVPVRAWPYVQKKTKKNFQTTTQSVPSLS